MSGTQTEDDRRALLAEAMIYGLDLVALSTEHPNGSATLEWDVLEQAVMEARPTNQPRRTP